MDRTKGIAAIFLCFALLLMRTHCLQNSFNVGNLAIEDLTSWGFKVNWDAPTGATVADCYRVELWSGSALVETQIVTAPTTEYTFEGLPDNMGFRVVVYSVDKFGDNDVYETYSTPEFVDPATPDCDLILNSRSESTLQLTLPTPEPTAPTQYHVEYRDVDAGTPAQSNTINVNPTLTTFTLSNLNNVGGNFKGGRLIQVTVKAEESTGEIIGVPCRFRTVLENPIGFTFSNPTTTSVEVRTTYVADVDSLAFEITCADAGCDIGDGLIVPTVSNAATVVDGLSSGFDYNFKVVASVGEGHRDTQYRPTYREAESSVEMYTLLSLTCGDGQLVSTDPTELHVQWTPPNDVTPTNYILKATNPSNQVIFADTNPLASSATSGVISGLAAGTLYNIELLYTDGASNQVPLTERDCYTPLEPVTGLTIKDYTQTSITVEWDDASPGLDFHYELDISPDSNDFVERPKGDRFRTTLPEYTFFGLTPGLQYTIDVQVRAEDPDNFGSFLTRSEKESMSITTRSTGLSRVGGCNDKNSVELSWTNSLNSATSQFQVTLQSFYGDSELDGDISPSTVQTFPATVTKATFEGLQPGNRYIVYLQELDENGDTEDLTSMVFRCLIDIYVVLEQWNPKYSLLQFNPADGISYDNYKLEVTSATGGAECQAFANDFGCQELELDGCTCGRALIHNPAGCEVTYSVAAYNDHPEGEGEVVVSEYVTLSADSDAVDTGVVYTGDVGPTYYDVWWGVDQSAGADDFDFYNLEVSIEVGNAVNVVYCTTIPFPTDPWVEWRIDNLEPGTCYTIRLEQWLYSDLANNVNSADLLDIEREICTELGTNGEVSSLYVLTLDGNDVELGWGVPPINDDEFTRYQVCIEPVKNPAAYEPQTVESGTQVTDLIDAVDREFSRRYTVGVSTLLDVSGGRKRYSDARCDIIDLDAPFRGELIITDFGITSLGIQWQRDEGFLPTTSNYVVTVKDADDVQVGSQINVGPTTSTTISQMLASLESGTYYCIEVEWVGTVPQVTREVCDRTCPNQPGAFTTKDTDLTTIFVEWDEATGNKDYYLIYATDLTNSGERIRKGRVDQDEERSFVIEGLIPDTRYQIEVGAVTGTEADNKESDPRVDEATTNAIDECDIIITSLDKDWIEVRWGPCSEADTIQICPSPGPPPAGDDNFVDTLDISDRVTGDDRVYTFEGLRASKKYSIFLKGNGEIIDTVVKYTEPFQPTLEVIESSPTVVKVQANPPAGQDFPDDLHTVKYELYDAEGELLRTGQQNGQNAFGHFVWSDLEPDTDYTCKATIVAGYEMVLQTPSDPLETAVQCATSDLQSNEIYVQNCDENSISLRWGDLLGNVRYQIDIDPPPSDFTAPYRFDIAENNMRQIGGLQSGQTYTVSLLQSSGVTPSVEHTIKVFTKPSQVSFEVEREGQTSIAIRWLWPHDQDIDFFTIDYTPVIVPQVTPVHARFWRRDYVISCLLPGQQVRVELTSVIENDGDYYSSQPYTRLITPLDLPESKLDIICACFSDDSFTVAWSDWIAPFGFDFDGYVLNLFSYDADTVALSSIDEVKVAPGDSELFHHFYNLGDEFNGDAYELLPTHFYVTCVSAVGENPDGNTNSDTRAYKVILTRPRPPSNLRRVTLPDPLGKIALKVEWDPSEDSNVDFYKVYYNRFGYPDVYEDTVDADDELEYTLTGLDPRNPDATVDLGNPDERPPAYSVWVVAVYTGTFVPPAEAERRKKRQAIIGELEETEITVESEPATLSFEDGLTVPIDPMEILAQVVGTRDILTLFGADPDNADPNGKYRFFIDTAEDPDFEARGGTLDVANADYFFEYLFDDLIPGTVFTITLSVELEEPVDDQDDIRSSIEVLTCPEPPEIIELSQIDAVTATFTWPAPYGQVTHYEVTFERPDEDPQIEITEDNEITFDRLFPDMEYTVTVRSVRIWEKGEETKESDPVELTIETTDLSALQCAIQDYGSDFINIVFGETIQDVVYEVSINPGNCPCGWREYGDNCYYIAHTARVDYSDAEDLCEDKDSMLVSILDQDEQDFLAECTENDPDTTNFGFWLGLNDINSEGNFVYDDGSTPAYENWDLNEPDNGGGGPVEDCAIMWQIPNVVNEWGDVPCSQEQAFICKKEKARPGINYPVQPSATTAHEFTELTPGQCHSMTVDADEYSPQRCRQRTNPAQVSTITPEVISPVSVHLSWELPEGVHDGFDVSYGHRDSGEDLKDYPYRLLKGVDRLQLWDLDPDTEYVVKITTVSSYGECDEETSEAQEFEFRTLPVQQGTVYLKDIDTDSITIKWGTPTTTQTFTGYRVRLCSPSCEDPIMFGPSKNKYTFMGLVPGREYSIIFEVARTNDQYDPEQLIVTRTSPLPVGEFEAESTQDGIRFYWEAPPGGEYDQYVLWYTTCNCLRPEENDLKYEVYDANHLSAYLPVHPGSVVYASLSVRSQVECPSQPSDSAPAFIYGIEADNLDPLEIAIIDRDTDSMLLSWGPAAGDDVVYTLSWFSEPDESDLKQRETKNTRWLIQGLTPGESYFIWVEYANLESPNKGFYSTALWPPSGLDSRDITWTTAELFWNEDSTGSTNGYLVYSQPWNDNVVPPYRCAARFILDNPFLEEEDLSTEAELNYLDPGVQYKAKVVGQYVNEEGNEVARSDPATEIFNTDSIPFGECRIVGLDSTSIQAVWDSVVAPTPAPTSQRRYDVYKYRRTVRVDESDEVHGTQEFTPSDHPYVDFENLWPGRQYEVCCEVYQINIDEPEENCIPQVTAPQSPFTVSIRDEHLRGFCAYWDGPHTHYDNYVIKVLDEEGNIVYPPTEDATVPEADPEYEVLPDLYTYRCIDTLLPCNTYTFVVGTWVDGEPEPLFSEMLEVEVETECLDPLELLVETQTKDMLIVQWGEIAGVDNPEYTVTWYKEGGEDNKQSFTTMNTRYIINDLDSGTGYYMNIEYLDLESENSGFFYTIPCPPEDLTETTPVSGTRFSLTWEPPSEGGYEGFRISYFDPDDSEDPEKIEAGVVEADVHSYTVVGLYVDQEYTFCVETIVDFDAIPEDTSSEPLSIEGSTESLAPLEIEVSGRDTDHFLVGWGPITGATSQETQYVVTALTEAGTIAALDTVPIGDRTNSLLIPVNSGIKYNIQVTIGERESEVVCIYSLPEPPGEIFLLEATSSTLDIGWGPAENFVGEYEIFYEKEIFNDQGVVIDTVRTGPITTSPQDRFLELEDLEPGTEYKFSIVNTVGEDDLKTDSLPSVATFTTRSAVLTILEPTIGTDTISVRWTPEVGEFENYLLRIIDTDAGSSRDIIRDTAPNVGNEQEIGNLIPGTLYRLELYTINEDGDEELSDIAEVITDPAPPQNLQLRSSTFSSLSLEWDAPLQGRWDGFEVIYDYVPTTNPDNNAVGRTPSPTDITDTGIVLEGLLPEQDFRVMVRTFRQFGDEIRYSESIEQDYSTLVAPEGKLIVRSVTKDSIGVYWTSISGANDYRIQLRNINNNDVIVLPDPFTGNTALLEDLVSGAVYEIQLYAVLIDSGDSQIQATLPCALTALTRIQRSINSITLGWNGLDGGQEGEATGFIVSYDPVPDGAPPFQEIPNPAGENAEVTLTLDNLLTDQQYDFTIVTYTEFEGSDGVVRREVSDEFEHSVTTHDLNPAQVQITDIEKDYVCFKWGGTDAGVATYYELSLVDVDNATAPDRTQRIGINVGTLEYCFEDLQPGTLYDLEVAVLGTLELGTDQFRTDACSPPNLREVISFQCSITIAWDPADGQADAYRIYYRRTDPPDQEYELAEIVFPGQALTYTLEDLDPETGYEFIVKTVAGGDLQEISDAAATVVYTDIETLLVTQTGNALTVSWPSIDGEFLLYELHHSPSDGNQPSSVFVSSTAQRLVQLTGLTAGQQYNLVLNLVSPRGERDLVAQTCFTLQPPPIFGDSLLVTPVQDEPQTVLVTFDNPSNFLKTAIIEALRIVATPATAGAGTGNTPVELEYIVPFEACPEIRLTGLCPDTYYVITIYTLSGTSVSEPVTTSLTTPPALPGQISFGEYEATSLEVFWATAGDDVDYTVRISYETPDGTAQVKEQITSSATEDRTYVFRNLTPGTLYTVTVSATTSSTYLDRKSLRTRPIPLFGSLRASYIGHDTITLSWPAATGVDGYEVCYYDAEDQESKSYDVHVTFTDSTIEALLPETAYVFSVASFIGDGADRSTSQKLTLVAETDSDPVVPQPRNVFVSGFGPHDVTVQWDAPSRDEYDYFLVEYSPDDAGSPESPVLLPPNQFVLSVSDLVPDTDYEFTVTSLRGRAGLDESRSEPVSVSAETASLPFIIRPLEITDTTIQVTWGPYESDAVDHYEVSYVPEEGFITDPIVDEDETRVAYLRSLRPNALYRITVSAVNELGEVLNVAIAPVQTLKLPVRSLKASDETTNSVYLFWPPAVDQLPNGQLTINEEVEGYVVLVRSYTDYRHEGDVIREEYHPLSACPGIWLRDLYPGHKYHVSVMAVDADGNFITAPASIVVETLPHGYLDLHVVSVDTTSIEVAWSPPSSDFANYLLLYSPAGQTPTFRIFSKAEERRWELEGLTPGQLYTIELIVQSIDNTELYSTVVYKYTIPTTPNDIIFSRITNSGFNTAWPAVFSGRSDFYAVCIFPDPQNINSPVTFVYDALNYDFDGLQPNRNYLVSVFNEVGGEVGDLEEWSNEISDYQETTVGEPGVPIVVRYDETSVTVSWVRVEGAQRYFVRRAAVDGTGIASDTVNAGLGLTVEYTFNGLQPGQEYFFYVNPDSAEYQEEYTKQRTKPLSPLFVRTEYNAEDPTQRIITWQPSGGGIVDRYELVYTPPIGDPRPPIYVPGSGAFLRQVITGLDPAQQYQFIVTAEAGIGEDQIRTRSDPAVADLDIVIRLAVENYGHYAIDVTWPTLPNEFDSYVISYNPYDAFKPNVRPSPVEIGKQFGITSLNIYGLIPGQEYTIYLQTKTGLVVSPIIQQVTQTTIPLPVDEVRVDLVTASSFTFSWDDAAGLKDQYQVFFEPIADENNPAPALGSLQYETFHTATGGLTSVTVTDLEAAQEYRITVVTWSNDQFSYGTSVIATTRPYPPNFVEVLDTTTNSALIQWYDGEVGNLGITRYQIEVVPRDGTRTAVIDADSERNTHRVTGLHSGRPYQALIQSVVVDGNGYDLESLPVSVAFVTVPLPPIFRRDVEATSTSVTLRWQSGGGDLTSYSLEYSPVPDNPSVPSPQILQPRPEMVVTISGLDSSTTYSFTVKAISRVTVQDSQTGTFDVIKESNTATIHRTTLPNPVRNFRVTGTTPTSVELAWEAPDGPVENYHLLISEVGGPVPNRPINIPPHALLVYNVQGLDPYTHYNFQILNVVGGVESTPASVAASTGEDVPGAPGGLLVHQVSPNSILVEWEPTENPNGELEGYVVVYTKRDLYSPGNIKTYETELLPLDQTTYELTDLDVGYGYAISVVAVNNLGPGEPYHLGRFVPLRETAPPHTGHAPFRTPGSDGRAPDSISITFRESFFNPIYGRVANYSVLVAEEPNPRDNEVSLSLVPDPPQTWRLSSTQQVWPGYQASPRGFYPFTRGIVKRQARPGPGQDTQAEFVIGTEEKCPEDQFYYCNGPLKSYTYYRVAIRAYGVDGNYTDTPWSEPLATGFDVMWFVYALAGVVGFVMLCFVIILCVCCGGCGEPGEMDFEDSEEDKRMLMMKNLSPPPIETRHMNEFTNYYQPSHAAPSQRAPTERSYQPPAPKRHLPASRPEPRKPTAKARVYATPTSQWSKPIYVDQFGEHMRMMNANGGQRFQEELNRLNDIGSNMPCNAAANAPEKNRYRNILPYDTNRVTLHDPPDGLDYVNASYVDGHHGNNEYIVTQGPLPNTIEDFWEMVWENEIPTIIMNTNLVENGRVKCEKYWPDSGEAQYGRMTVKLISESDTKDWTVRTFEIAKDGETKGHVRVFQFRNWPDQGAPRDPRSVLKFLQTVRAQHPRRSGPGIVVHCSAGVGRSGTFVATDILLQQLASGNNDTIDIFGVCAKLRRQRRYMVQSEEQYKFVHRAVQVFREQQANYEVMMDGGSNWAMGSSASGGRVAYTNKGSSIDGDL